LTYVKNRVTLISMSKKTKKLKKIKKASNFVFKFLRAFFRPQLKRKYKFNFDKETSTGITRPCLILCNHQTSFDQFAVGVAFKFGINFVASDTIFSHGLGSWLMKVLTRTIPFSKGSSDPTAVKNMMQVIKDGGAVGIFPEGNRSYYGETGTVQPGTGRLAKKLGVPLVLCQIVGGYLTKSRWKPSPNKGKCTLRIVRVVSVEELKNMSDTEVQTLIEQTLYVNDFSYNLQHKIAFKGKNKADNLEGILFYCPKCHAFNSLHSSGDHIACTTCGFGTSIDSYGFFKPTDSTDTMVEIAKNSESPTIETAETPSFTPPEHILQWSHMQLGYVKHFDFTPYTDTPLFTDENIGLAKAVRTKKQIDRVVGKLEMYNDRLEVCGKTFMFDEIRSLNVQKTTKLFIFTATDTYVVDAPLKYNLVKYMICANHLKRLAEGKEPYYGY